MSTYPSEEKERRWGGLIVSDRCVVVSRWNFTNELEKICVSTGIALASQQNNLLYLCTF